MQNLSQAKQKGSLLNHLLSAGFFSSPLQGKDQDNMIFSLWGFIDVFLSFLIFLAK